MKLHLFLLCFVFQSVLQAHSHDAGRLLPVEHKIFPGVLKLSPDTIYQVDTVYQYVIVYDTIFFEELYPEFDSISSNESLDSINSVKTGGSQKKRIKKIEKQNQTRHAFLLPQSEARTRPDSSLYNQRPGTRQYEQVKSESGNEIKHSGTSKGKNRIIPGIKFPIISPRDTIFIFDTILKCETLLDTVLYNFAGGNPDTNIFHYTDYDKKGGLVIVKHTVKYTVKRQESTIIGNTASPLKKTTSSTSHTPSGIQGRFKSSFNRKWHNGPRYASLPMRENSTRILSQLTGGFSVASPTVSFSPEYEKYEDYTEYLNQNTQNRSSWGMFLTHNFIRNRIGIESGIGLSQTNFLFNHNFNSLDVDTSYYWQYFQNNYYLYDTTWYINIDTLLQTGNILLIPKIDSTLLSSNDSVSMARYDTTLRAMNEKYSCSTTQLELLINGRYFLNYGKFSVSLVAGIIPSLLIAKTGKLPAYESYTSSETNEVSYNLGFNLTAYGAVSLHYNFYGGFAVFAEPFVRRNLISTLKNNEFTYITNAAGIRFGLSYNLFSSKHE